MSEKVESLINLLTAANDVASKAVANGNHPFGAVLVDADRKTVLMSQGNVDTVRHAESELARKAAQTYDAAFLWNCALVTTLEPCAMCAGTIYWANIGTVVYGASETDLKELTGDDPQNPTMDLPCRHVFKAGQKKVSVFGPYPEVRDMLLEPHRNFWKHNS